MNETDYTLRKNPGISAFKDNIDGLDEYFEPFMEFILEKVKPKYFETTHIFLKATAGMRLLDRRDQQAILYKIRSIFRETPFQFKDSYVSIISGKEEGVYSWITVNYLNKRFKNGNHLDTFGALDLGGASTQITFAPKESPEQHGYNLTMGGITYNLYTFSFLDYGNDRALARKFDSLIDAYRKRFPTTPTSYPISDYCLPLGYKEARRRNGTEYTVDGRSQYTGCLRLVRNILQKKQCESCSIGDIWQPTLRGSFFAISGFVHPIDLFELQGEDTSLNDLKHATSKFCSMSYAELQLKYKDHKSWSYITTYCFMSTYIIGLLEERYSFSPCHKNAIIFKDKIGNFSISWAFGAMLFEADIIDRGNFFEDKNQILKLKYK